jgi:hypothetical protein
MALTRVLAAGLTRRPHLDTILRDSRYGTGAVSGNCVIFRRRIDSFWPDPRSESVPRRIPNFFILISDASFLIFFYNFFTFINVALFYRL